MFLLGSCNSITYLEKRNKISKSEYLLDKLKIKGNKSVDKEKFSALYQQKPNKKLPLLGSTPYFYFYIIGETVYSDKEVKRRMAEVEAKYAKKLANDTSDQKRRKRLLEKKEKKLDKLRTQLKEGNGFSRTFGEAPAIANEESIKRSATMMSQMLKAKGYYHNQVIAHFDTNGKKITVTYQVSEGLSHKVSSLRYNVKNAKVAALLNGHTAQSTIKTKSNLDETKLTEERDRLDKLMKNNGYYNFEKQSISYSIDTIKEAYGADIELIINADSNDLQFNQYKVDRITFVINQSKFRNERPDTTEYLGMRFVQIGKRYGRKVLASKTFFRPGSLYSVDNAISTQTALNNIDNFRFVDIRFFKNNKSDTSLSAVILLSSQKKYQITDEWGLNVTQGLPGPQVSLSFLDRNILQGCENLDFGIRYGIEGVASATSESGVYKSVEASVDMGITFPQFYIPTPLRFKFSRAYPKTRLNVAFNNIVRPEYTRTNYKVALTYTFYKSTFSRFIFSIADLNIIQTTKVSPSFQKYLEDLLTQGNTLIYSFQPSFVTDMNFSYIYNNNDFTKFVNGSFFRFYAENGGLVIGLLSNTLERRGIITDGKLFGELSYYQYAKSNIDWRLYRLTSPTSQVVSRVNVGAAYAFVNNVLPYEKYFFSGGSNGMRAWRPRRLGPGSKPPSTNPDGSFDYKYEQPAEIIIEANIESRFKIIKFIEGAAFVDMGNVWKIGNGFQSELPQDFNLTRFYKEIAVGTGLGLRLNFTFLVIRFDLGLKVYDPVFPEGDRLVVKNWSFKSVVDKNEYGLINLGIGYPF